MQYNSSWHPVCMWRINFVVTKMNYAVVCIIVLSSCFQESAHKASDHIILYLIIGLEVYIPEDIIILLSIQNSPQTRIHAWLTALGGGTHDNLGGIVK